MRRNPLAWTVACLLAASTVGVASAQSTSIALAMHADSLAGTIVHYDALGNNTGQEQINPQDEATTDTAGSDTENASTSSGIALGIHAYSLTTAQNGTTACNNAIGCDQATANTSASTVNLLGGLVIVDVQTTMFNAVADSTNPNQVDITAASASAASVSGKGISVAPGTYPEGTTFPVSGPITVPVLDAQGNPTGNTQTETFTGQLIVAQVLQGTDPSTGASILTFTAEQLVGQAPDGAGGTYQITLGGPLSPPSGTGSGPTYSIVSAPTFRVAG